MSLNEFFAPIYELRELAFFPDFSPLLYRDPNEFYVIIGFATIGISLLTVLLYYFVIGSLTPNWNKWYHWSIVLLITSVIAYKMMDIQVDEFMTVGGFEYRKINLIKISLINAGFSAILFFLFSFVRKLFPNKFQYTNIPF